MINIFASKFKYIASKCIRGWSYGLRSGGIIDTGEFYRQHTCCKNNIDIKIRKLYHVNRVFDIWFWDIFISSKTQNNYFIIFLKLLNNFLNLQPLISVPQPFHSCSFLSQNPQTHLYYISLILSQDYIQCFLKENSVA